MMTRTPDEIKKGLEKCSNSGSVCDGCEFSNGNAGKWKELMADALALIQKLQAENAEKAKTIMWMEAERDDLKRIIQQLEAERDAAVAGLKSNCTCPECKYFSDEIQEPCRSCKPNDSKFEWRGAQKEES